ncbi:hypothetical protein GCM10022281_12390 [Sphingomonas rosea]|uniref:Flagellar FliJ protein n=1 Tax=Sphingomonas rosea TaxID=335605 RepID=A0ABP7U0K1_9SPHN
MSRLGPAIRHRKRMLDQVAMEIAAEQARDGALLTKGETLTARRACERLRAAVTPVPSDAWFENTRRRLGALAAARAESASRLAELRHVAVEQRARLRLLEDAAAAAHAADRRRRERTIAAQLDDRTASLWHRA